MNQRAGMKWRVYEGKNNFSHTYMLSTNTDTWLNMLSPILSL